MFRTVFEKCAATLRRHPWLALLGFFPPVYVLGALICVLLLICLAVYQGRHASGSTALENILGVGIMLASCVATPIWPYALYLWAKDPSTVLKKLLRPIIWVLPK